MIPAMPSGRAASCWDWLSVQYTNCDWQSKVYISQLQMGFHVVAPPENQKARRDEVWKN